MKHDHSSHDPGPTAFWSSRYAIGLVVFGAIAAYFILTEHRAHFFDALPFVFLLACPLMHIFMHGGHHGHHADHENNEQNLKAPTSPQPDKSGEQI